MNQRTSVTSAENMEDHLPHSKNSSQTGQRKISCTQSKMPVVMSRLLFSESVTVSLPPSHTLFPLPFLWCPFHTCAHVGMYRRVSGSWYIFVYMCVVRCEALSSSPSLFFRCPFPLSGRVRLPFHLQRQLLLSLVDVSPTPSFLFPHPLSNKSFE